MVTDSQEKAFWRVIRPPPGYNSCVETPPMYKTHEGMKSIRRTNLLEDLRAEVDLLRTSCIRTRIKGEFYSAIFFFCSSEYYTQMSN